jgi:hypothetical protein
MAFCRELSATETHICESCALPRDYAKVVAVAKLHGLLAGFALKIHTTA